MIEVWSPWYQVSANSKSKLFLAQVFVQYVGKEDMCTVARIVATAAASTASVCIAPARHEVGV